MKKPLVLWGGVDVDSALYGKPRSKFAQTPNTQRDNEELTLIAGAIGSKTPVVGVCRGAQLLCVTNGGELYQHSVPYRQDHSLATKDELVFKEVTAGHHQIMIPKGDYVVYAWNPDAVRVWIDDETSVMEKNTAEVVWFPKHRQLAIQPHPEWARENDPFVAWVNKLMLELEIDYKF